MIRFNRKKAKRFIISRALPMFLAAVMLFTSAPMTGISVGEGDSAGEDTYISNTPLKYDYDTLKITKDGDEVSELEIYSHEKIEVSGAGLNENAKYQWQIKHPEKNNLWVDIYDATEDNIGVSVALINNMMAEDGTAKLRLRAYTEDYAYLSNALTVKLVEEESDNTPTLSVNTVTAPSAMAGGDEYVTVTIEYIQYDFKRDAYGNLEKDGSGNLILDNGKQAFSAYVATLINGNPLKTTVKFPTIVGYDSFWQDEATASTSYTFNEDSVTQNYVYKVSYKPKLVNYSIRYYLQNIYDDQYTEKASETGLWGYTGAEPEDIKLNRKFEGFTSLYHEPDTIAADGSTVFEVYYERNYYLMEFDCNGGYGTETLYVRYESYIVIPDPVRTGYVFKGWDLVKSENPSDPVASGDSSVDAVEVTMPAYNSAYRAIWDIAKTKFTVVYWIDNGDGTKTYIGSRPVDEESAQKVSGSDDLTADLNICGKEAHTHTSCTFLCGKTEHTHGEDCCIVHVHTDTCFSNCIHTTHGVDCYTFSGGTVDTTSPNNGNYLSYYDTYGALSVYRTRYGYTYYYVRINESYYQITPDDGINNFSSTLNCSHTHENQCYSCAYPGTSHTHGDGNCVYCSADEHTHAEKCYSCGKVAHTHSASCKNTNAPYMEFVKADQNVTVEGDGSTIVNVYYQYKTYTFKFYYAKEENGKFYIPGGSTWAFAGSSNNITTQLSDVSGIWGQVDSKPTLNTDAFQSETYEQYTINGTKGKYYYISLSAKYNEDISQKWPANPFNSVKTASTFDYGDYAYFSAWNVDANTWYDLEYENKTLKGNYQRLDYKLLIDEDTTTLNYLAFWENGKDGVGWNAPHKWIYNIHIPDTNGDFASEYNGVRYDLYGTYTIYDDNTATSTKPYCGQTPTALEGYELLTHTVKVVEEYDTTNDLFTYQIDFYYKANGPYSFSLYSYNAIMGGKGNGSAPFGMKLNEHEISATDMQNNYYPEGIEPGAYVFGGWYTTPDCIDGTEVDWDTLTMPNGDLTVYAKWTPIERTVTFYSAFSDIQKDKDDTSSKVYYFMQATGVPHGTPLGSAYLNTPEFPTDLDTAINGGDLAAEYDFVGWFYMDESNKKRFAPDSMDVTRDLVLFAEWQTAIDTTYVINYVLGADVAAHNTVTGTQAYPKDTVISDRITAHATVGQTKTFEAMSGKNLYTDFQKKFFPTVNSHSILMDRVPSNNTYTFEYMYDDKVYYKIQYLEQGTNKELHSPDIFDSDEAIISKKFKPIQDYLPTAYYITRTLQYDANATEPIEANVFTFYYVKDNKHALYSIEYYWENVDSTDSGNLSNYTLRESIIGTGNLNDPIEIEVKDDRYTGFGFQRCTVVNYVENGDEWTPTYTNYDTIPASGKITGTITMHGLEIKIYYKRNLMPYTIQYVEYGGDSLYTQNFTDPSQLRKFGTTVTYTAPATHVHDGLTYYFYATADKPQTQSFEIRAVEAENVITFYYKLKQYTINYVAYCPIPGAVQFGIVSPNMNIGERTTDITGSSASALSGYKFVGWRDDAGNQVSTNALWNPGSFERDASDKNPGDGIITYYAYFMPVSSSLVINKTVDVTTTDTFLFHIQGSGKFSYVDMIVSIQGSGSVTINEIPQGEYTITEFTGWSWEYDCTSASAYTITIGSAAASVTFTNKSNPSNWLNGEAVNENQFEIND